MTLVSGFVIGAAIGAYLLRLPKRVLARVDSRHALPLWLQAGLLAVGGMTGSIAMEQKTLGSVILGIVAALLIVQAPVDAYSHRLLRRPTQIATGSVASVYFVSSLLDTRVLDTVSKILVTLTLVMAALLLCSFSPKSLGFGDVLLLIPLTLAVAYFQLDRVVFWQLLSAASGAFHGLLVWMRQRRLNIPFGPHLLGAAWLILALSV